jgi:hypothetical protein
MIKDTKVLGVKAPTSAAHLLGVRLENTEAAVSIAERAGVLVVEDNAAVLSQRGAEDLETADGEGVFPSALRRDAAVLGYHRAAEQAVAGGGIEGLDDGGAAVSLGRGNGGQDGGRDGLWWMLLVIMLGRPFDGILKDLDLQR